MRPTPASNMEELANEKHRRSASRYDVYVGDVWCAFWSLCRCPELQYTHSDTAAMFLCSVFDVLGSVLDVFIVRIVFCLSHIDGLLKVVASGEHGP